MFSQRGGFPPRVDSPNLKVTTQLDKLTMSVTLIDKIGVHPSNIIEIGEHRYKLIFGPNELEKVIEEENLRILKANGIEPHIDSDLYSKRTLLLRNVDHVEMSQTDEYLIGAIERKNQVKVEKIIRIPTRVGYARSNTLKIVFGSSDDNDKIKMAGLKMSYTMVNVNNIIQEVPLQRPLICKKCYKIDAHHTRQCQAQGDICSLCGNAGHRYNECNSNVRRCINCEGSHCTLVLSCPKIKEAMKKFNNDAYNSNRNVSSTSHSGGYIRDNTSFAGALSGSTKVNRPQVGEMSYCNDSLAKYYDAKFKYDQLESMCARLENPRENLRKFKSLLDQSLIANGLPTVIIPESILNEYSPMGEANYGAFDLPSRVNSVPIQLSDETANVDWASREEPVIDDTTSMDVTFGNNKRNRDNSLSPTHPFKKQTTRKTNTDEVATSTSDKISSLNANVAELVALPSGKISSPNIADLGTLPSGKISSINVAELETSPSGKISSLNVAELGTLPSEKISSPNVAELETLLSGKISSPNVADIETSIFDKFSAPNSAKTGNLPSDNFTAPASAKTGTLLSDSSASLINIDNNNQLIIPLVVKNRKDLNTTLTKNVVSHMINDQLVTYDTSYGRAVDLVNKLNDNSLTHNNFVLIDKDGKRAKYSQHRFAIGLGDDSGPSEAPKQSKKKTRKTSTSSLNS